MNAPATRDRPAAVTVFQNTRALMVRNLRPGLAECGKIKIGVKGEARKSKGGNEFQPPKKLDHFVVTTLERGDDGNFRRDDGLHEKLGDSPKDIPVRLLFNDPWLNFQTSYVAFVGAKRFCTGDGAEAERLAPDGSTFRMACPCEKLERGYNGRDKCKINGTLSVVIDGAPVVGGVWKLRTTSFNTCQGIASSLALLSSVTGGQIAGVPLSLTIRPKAATTPDGQSTTVYVVGLEYRGTVDQLRDLALERARADAVFGERMARIEDQARAMLQGPQVGTADLEEAEEFYPEAARTAHAAAAPAAERPSGRDGVVGSHPVIAQLYDAASEAFAKLSDNPAESQDDMVKVFDTDGGTWSVAATKGEALEIYGDLKKKRSDKALVAFRNLAMLKSCLAVATNGLRTRLENEIAAAEVVQAGEDGPGEDGTAGEDVVQCDVCGGHGVHEDGCPAAEVAGQPVGDERALGAAASEGAPQ